MAKVFYLAYGSNLHPLRLGDRVSSAKFIGIVHLCGYKLRFHKVSNDDSGKCLLEKTDADSDIVFAALYEFDDKEKTALDKVEGKGYGYEDEEMTVIFNGHYYDSFIYMASSSHIDANLIPYTWYKNFVLAGARFHNLPVDYISNIESIDSKEDIKESRKIENEMLLEKMQAYR